MFGSSAGELEVRTIAKGLANPWALAFLPDGKMLVTERPGRMRIVTAEGQISPPLKGVPDVWASGQGGLLDVVTDKSFAENRTIYFCFAERTDGGGRTTVARAKLNDGNGRLDDVRIIFRQQGPLSSGNHFGCRIAQAEDGNLFVALGDHFTHRDQAQNLGNHLGKLIRIAPDGSVPSGNPFAGRADAKPEIWSYGHRNIQALAINPAIRRALGNRARPARRRRGQRHRQGQELRLAGDRLRHRLFAARRSTTARPRTAWSSRSNTGCRRSRRRAWRSTPESCFRNGRAACSLGALRGAMLVRLTLNGNTVTSEERLLQNLNERIRDVRQGPDGALWLLTDSSSGRILRVAPAAK